MDAVTLVENQIEDGQRLLERLAEEGIIVRAACWVKPVEEDRWSLYIVAPAVDEQGAAAAYRQVYQVLRSLEGAWITDSDIKLIGEKHPVARDALKVMRPLADRAPVHSRRPVFGGIPTEEVVIYPVGKGAPVEVPIYGQAFRGQPGGDALHLSFEPHSPHAKLTVESMGERKEFAAQTGIDWTVAAPEGARLERDENGQLALTWKMRGRKVRSRANEVWSLANLGLHGFRFLREPA